MLTLRPYQQAAISAIYKYYEEKQGNCCVVLPTAAGKSLVAAAFIEGVLKAWPDQRILIVTHVRELIAQNHAEMIGVWPEAPAGIYSAGLGKREAQARIEWVDGGLVPFLGQPRRLVLQPDLNGVALSADERNLLVGLGPQATPAQVKDQVHAWLQREARHIFAARVAHFAQRLGVTVTRISLSSARTRWGSASADGKTWTNVSGAALSASTPFHQLQVDGGSTDGTPEIVRRRMAAEPRLRLIHN